MACHTRRCLCGSLTKFNGNSIQHYDDVENVLNDKGWRCQVLQCKCRALKFDSGPMFTLIIDSGFVLLARLSYPISSGVAVSHCY